MEDDIFKWLVGGGVGVGVAGVAVQFIRGLVLRDQANRADLTGNMTVMANQGQFIDDLVQNISDLRRENSALRDERDDWQRKYYDILIGKNNG